MASRVLPSNTGVVSKSCNTCLMSLRYALVPFTHGSMKLSMYCPILAVRESIPLTIGLSGGFSLFLCILGNV